MDKRGEVQAELERLLGDRGLTRFLDAVLPLTGYFVLEYFSDVGIALAAALIGAVVVGLVRLYKRESLVYILTGIAGVVLSAILVQRSGSGVDFYIPGLASGAITIILCLGSVLLNRPWIAYSSWLLRRWPMEWYWHPQVIPAYKEVTMGWALAYAIRLSLELWLFQRGAVTALGTVRLFLGWPFILGLLIASYLYGVTRLKKLEGPSVEEFKSGSPPPWEGQKSGF